MTRRDATNLSYALLTQVAGDAVDVPFWTDVFLEKKGRLPNDYPELQHFAVQYFRGTLHMKPYDRVDLALLPSGMRQIVCYTVTDGITNKTRLAWGKPLKSANQ